MFAHIHRHKHPSPRAPPRRHQCCLKLVSPGLRGQCCDTKEFTRKEGPKWEAFSWGNRLPGPPPLEAVGSWTPQIRVRKGICSKKRLVGPQGAFPNSFPVSSPVVTTLSALPLLEEAYSLCKREASNMGVSCPHLEPPLHVWTPLYSVCVGGTQLHPLGTLPWLKGWQGWGLPKL